MKSKLTILLLSLTIQLFAQDTVHEYKSYKRIGNSSGYGFANSQGDTIIPIGKYKFLNPIDDQGMILAIKKNGKHGYIDIHDNILIPFEYDDLGVFSHNLIFAEKDGVFGYLNRAGKAIIDFQFLEANYFYSPGIAVVKKKSGWGLVDTIGNFEVDCLYDEIDYSRQNQVAIVEKNKKWAFYFNDSKSLTDFEFDEILKSTNRIPNKRYYNTIKDLFFNRGLALVKKNIQFALINRSLDEIVKYGTYDHIKPMNCYGFSIVSKDGKNGIIDSMGVLKIPLEYDLISIKPARSYGNEFTTFLVKKSGKYQILNNQAEFDIKKEFNKVDVLTDNYYLAYENDSVFLIDDNSRIIANEYTGYYDFDKGFIVKRADKMGTIDYQGNTALSFTYDSLYHPHLENYLYAQKDGKFGVIDFEGNVMIPFEYEFITRVWYDDYEDYEDNLIVQKNKKLGTINMKNEIDIPLIYDGICSWIEYSPDEHYVKKGNKYGMVKPNGEIMIPCLYDYIHYYTSQSILVKKDNKFGILSRRNKTIVPCEYEKIMVDIDYWGFDENRKDQLVLFKDGIWDYYDLSGKLINKNISEDEILEKYPFANDEFNNSIDYQLILVD